MLVVGAGGFAKELIEAIYDNGLEKDLVFLDTVSKSPSKKFYDYTLLTTADEAKEYFRQTDSRFALGVGPVALREKLSLEMKTLGGEGATLLSAKAQIGRHENIFKEGCCVMQQSIVENSNTIGKYTLIHVGAFISHDVAIGDYCEISPYAKILGKVKIGNKVSIGAGAIILPGIQIADGAVVGAGAVVTKNISEATTVAGVPARQLKKT